MNSRVYGNIIPPTTGTLLAAKMLINNARIAWKEENFAFSDTGSNVSYDLEYKGEKYSISVYDEFVWISTLSSHANPDDLAAAMGLPTKVTFASAKEFYDYKRDFMARQPSNSSGCVVVLGAMAIPGIWALVSNLFG